MLDTGVKREHHLLEPLIAAADCHAYRDDWGTDDHHGHGTAMAGVCGYGDLASAIGNGSPVTVPYRMESVKIFPPVGQNPHELLGAITAGGVAKVELPQPQRKRVFCLATSTDEDSPHRGRPTSWSAEIDQLCFGSEVTPRIGRLFCVAAGNVREPQQLRHEQYPTLNDLSEIESPAQAWNALTVGGVTGTYANNRPQSKWLGLFCGQRRSVAYNHYGNVECYLADETRHCHGSRKPRCRPCRRDRVRFP